MIICLQWITVTIYWQNKFLDNNFRKSIKAFMKIFIYLLEI